ncbi:hypothetical protein GCM10010486_67180 [Nonomuraea roseoviolacea subsp. carminata]
MDRAGRDHADRAASGAAHVSHGKSKGTRPPGPRTTAIAGMWVETLRQPSERSDSRANTVTGVRTLRQLSELWRHAR